MNDRERAICARLKEFREALHWPQPDFARETGMTRDKLASIEYGRTPFRYPVFIAICEKFGLNPIWLSTGQSPPKYPNIYKRLKDIPYNPRQLFSEVYDKEIETKLATFIEDAKEYGTMLSVCLDDLRDLLEARNQGSINDRQKIEEQIAIVLPMVEKMMSDLAINEPVNLNVDKIILEKDLTNITDIVNIVPVKPQLPALLERLNKATAERGQKSTLAKFLGVPLANVSQWLSGARSPDGENTLRLLKWVEQQERQK